MLLYCVMKPLLGRAALIRVRFSTFAQLDASFLFLFLDNKLTLCTVHDCVYHSSYISQSFMYMYMLCGL